MLFADRIDAGRKLAQHMEHLRAERPVILALPRGGVPVAFEIASALDAPLDVIVVRKLGAPMQPELGMGAIGEGGVKVVNRELMARSGVTDSDLAAVEARERTELERRAEAFRQGRPMYPLEGRTVVIVDDGIATGSTARAACRVARAHGAARVVLAVPVAPPRWAVTPGEDADEFICLDRPAGFMAIGQFYADFTQTSDDEVIDRLFRSAARIDRRVPDGSSRDVDLHAGAVHLPGHLVLPSGAVGMVAFAHGSGSSRLSPRNEYVASVLHEASIGTLLFDLLTEAEALDRRNVFDIDLLAQRLVAATRWLEADPELRDMAIGYFGASTGAAAALWAATEPEIDIAAIVSRGGRPDLAAERLPRVLAPTLLIVGGEDRDVLELNRRAAELLPGTKHLVVIEGASHLFREPGTLRMAADAARDWFVSHF